MLSGIPEHALATQAFHGSCLAVCPALSSHPRRL
jgi:hypothetical protein